MLRVPCDRIEPGATSLADEAARYVTRVHRMTVGDRFVLFDPRAAVEADAEISAIDRRAVRVVVSAPRPASIRPRRRVTLIQATGKGDKLDAIVRDATELGATRIVPALAERSVARPGRARAERWRRIAVEAARQCGRGDAPAIDEPTALLEALGSLACPGLCMDPGAARPIADAFAKLVAAPELAIVVGPEGGLTEAELEAAAKAGLTRVTLGPLVLRTETVCAAVLGALLAFG